MNCFIETMDWLHHFNLSHHFNSLQRNFIRMKPFKSATLYFFYTAQRSQTHGGGHVCVCMCVQISRGVRPPTTHTHKCVIWHSTPLGVSHQKDLSSVSSSAAPPCGSSPDPLWSPLNTPWWRPNGHTLSSQPEALRSSFLQRSVWKPLADICMF